MTNPSELNACKFCNHEAKIISVTKSSEPGVFNGYTHQAHCTYCSTQSGWAEDKQLIIDWWNGKYNPIESALNEQIREQGELIEKLGEAINKTFDFSVNLKPASEYDGRQIGKLSGILNKALSAYTTWKEKNK